MSKYVGEDKITGKAENIDEIISIILPAATVTAALLLLLYTYMVYPQWLFIPLLIIIIIAAYFLLPLIKPENITTRKYGKPKKVWINGSKKMLSRIAPDNVKFFMDYARVNNKYMRVLYPKDYPPVAYHGWLNNYMNMDAKIMITQHITPMTRGEAEILLNKQILKVDSALIGLPDGHPAKEKIQQKSEWYKTLKSRVCVRKEENMFKNSLYFTVFADTKKELNNATTMLGETARGDSIPLEVPSFRTESAYLTIGPRNYDALRKTHPFDTYSLSTLFPFIQNIFGTKQGVLYGFNPSYQPIILDRFKARSSHTIISGTTGSGKSFITKMLIIREKLYNPPTMGLKIFIIDPTGEFTRLTRFLGGQVISIGAENTIINPLDIKTVSVKSTTPVMEKTMELINFFDIAYSLTSHEKAILQQIIPQAYEQMGITDKISIETYMGDSPIFSDLQNMLKTYRENRDATVEDKQVASKLVLYTDMFVNGPLKNFNKQTTISLTSDIICFDISTLSTMENIFTPLMSIVMSYIDGKVKETPNIRKILVIDECHRILDNPRIRKFLERMVREYRKHNAGACLISQSIEDFLQSPEGESIVNLCYYNILMVHDKIGEKTEKFYDLNELEKQILLYGETGKNTNYSECIMVAGKSKTMMKVYAFDYEYPYLTTTPAEVAEIEKKEQEVL